MEDYDIYSLIRSKEIREYFRETWKMNIKEQVQLVALSYEGIPKKVKILRWLAGQSEGEDSALASSVADYLELGYNAVAHPSSDAVYLLEWSSAPQRCYDKLSEWDKYCDMIEGETGNFTVHNSFEEVMEYARMECEGDEDIRYEGIVRQINLPRKKRKAGTFENDEEDWCSCLAWIDGKWEVRRCEGDADWFLAQGVSEDTMDMAKYFIHWSMFDHHFTLPFERGSRLKLQTPIMREPLVGIFDPYYSDFEHRHHHFYCENHLYLCQEEGFPVEKDWKDERHLLLSYHIICSDDGYSLFDWLERADKE